MKIEEFIKSNKPFAVGKIGITELRHIEQHLLKTEIDKEKFNRIFINCGIFPETNEAILEFIEEIFKIMPKIDGLPMWNTSSKRFEEKFIKEFSNINLIDVHDLEPYYSQDPWSQYLKNKKVLIISPFTDSIEKQYEKRSLLWKDERVLPTFELKTLKHQHSPALGTPSQYDSWIEMLADVKRKIELIDFDIALIGTGASSLPLAAHCKSIGKQAIHLGGSLQILFGIKGYRWDKKPHIKRFYNEHWVRPSGDEIPKKYIKNEDGCYW